MQSKEQAIKTLIEELDYCYCDNCKFSDYDTYKDNYCKRCYKKDQNWALSEEAAKEIVNKIYEGNINAE